MITLSPDHLILSSITSDPHVIRESKYFCSLALCTLSLTRWHRWSSGLEPLALVPRSSFAFSKLMPSLEFPRCLWHSPCSHFLVLADRAHQFLSNVTASPCSPICHQKPENNLSHIQMIAFRSMTYSSWLPPETWVFSFTEAIFLKH